MKKIISITLMLVCFLTAFLGGCGKEKTHTVTIYSSKLSQEELDDLDAFAEKNGYLSARYSKRDGLVYVTLDETNYDSMMYSIGVSVIRNVYGLMEDKEYSYIKKIDRNDNFSEMKVFVEKKGFEKSGQGELLSTYIGNSCVVYLKYDTELKTKEKVCTVTFYDEKTEEVLLEDSYSVNDN